MDSNLVICRNEVFIEGESVGEFEAFRCQGDYRTLGMHGVLTMPLYAIGPNGDTSGTATSRMRKVFATADGSKRSSLVVPCAQVEVWCWYDGWDINSGTYVEYGKIKVFQGFIDHVEDGFPTKIHVQDNSFILRFGDVQKTWSENVTIQTMVDFVVPIANSAFENERKSLGFKHPAPSLVYNIDGQNVQAYSTPLAYREWSNDPYSVVQDLMRWLSLYGGVTDDYNVYVGAGVEKASRPLIELSTKVNVIERDLVPIDGRFIDFDVKVTGVLSNGRRYTATGGLPGRRNKETRSEIEKEYAGESHRYFTLINTEAGINEFADRMLARLRGKRNSGSIRTLLYPKMQLLDWVTYTDTVFNGVSGGYFVEAYEFDASINGYFQTLEVTSQIFNI